PGPVPAEPAGPPQPSLTRPRFRSQPTHQVVQHGAVSAVRPVNPRRRPRRRPRPRPRPRRHRGRRRRGRRRRSPRRRSPRRRGRRGRRRPRPRPRRRRGPRPRPRRPRHDRPRAREARREGPPAPHAPGTPVPPRPGNEPVLCHRTSEYPRLGETKNEGGFLHIPPVFRRSGVGTEVGPAPRPGRFRSAGWGITSPASARNTPLAQTADPPGAARYSLRSKLFSACQATLKPGPEPTFRVFNLTPAPGCHSVEVKINKPPAGDFFRKKNRRPG